MVPDRRVVVGAVVGSALLVSAPVVVDALRQAWMGRPKVASRMRSPGWWLHRMAVMQQRVREMAPAALEAVAAALASLCVYRICCPSRPKAPQRDPWKVAMEGVNLAELSPSQFWHRLERVFQPPHTLARAETFRPSAGDVVTLTTPKTGQTWLIAQLRMLSLGKRDVAHSQLAAKVSAEGDGVPWLEHPASSQAIDAPQPGQFRIFKSHLLLRRAREMVDACPDARFITCLRAPHDVTLSFFTHMRGVWAKRCNGGDAAPFDAAFSPSSFALAGLPSQYEDNLLDWLELKDRPNVLIMWYEDMVADSLGALRTLAAFVGAPLDAGLEESVLEVTSYATMASSPAFGNVFPGGGTYGRGRSTLSPEAVAAVDERWRKVIDKTGAHSYEALYSELHGGSAFPFHADPQKS